MWPKHLNWFQRISVWLACALLVYFAVWLILFTIAAATGNIE